MEHEAAAPPGERPSPPRRRVRPPRGQRGSQRCAEHRARRRRRAAGSAATRNSRYCGNASISLAWMGRWRIVRIIARDRGRRAGDQGHEQQREDEHEPPRSVDVEEPRPEEQRAEERMRELIRRDPFRAVRDLRSSEPTAAAAASRKKQHEAVRIDRRVRHTSAKDCRSVTRGRRGRTHVAGTMRTAGGTSEAGREPAGAARSGTRVKVPVMSMMPIPTSSDPETTRDRPVVAAEPVGAFRRATATPRPIRSERDAEPERVARPAAGPRATLLRCSR